MSKFKKSISSLVFFSVLLTLFSFYPNPSFKEHLKVYATDTVLQDDLSGSSNWYSSSGTFRFDTSDPTNYNGDVNRVTRIDDTNNTITYYLQNFNSFKIITSSHNLAYGNQPVPFNLSISKDGNVWSGISYDSNYVNTGSGGWKTYELINQSEIETGYSYFKITFKSLGANWWASMLNNVILTVSEKYTVKNDHLLNNGNWNSSSGTFRFDTADPTNYNGDVDRVTRIDDTLNTITYYLPNFNTFNIISSAHTAAGSNQSIPFNFSISMDGNVWKSISSYSSTLINSGTGGWSTYKLTNSSEIQPGYSYFKITFKSLGTNWWASMLNDVVLTHLEYKYSVKNDHLVNNSNWSASFGTFRFDTANPTNYNGDIDRVTRIDDSLNSITYYNPNTNSFKITASGHTAASTNQSKPFNIYLSRDNNVWGTALTYTSTLINTGTNGWKTYELTNSSEIEPGFSYIKIVFKSLGTANYYASMLNDVVLTHLGKYTVRNDHLSDNSIWNESSGTFRFDYADAANYNGDTNRVTRVDDSLNTIIYDITNITKFKIVVSGHTAAGANQSQPVTISLSHDKQIWTDITCTSTQISSHSSGWKTYEMTTSSAVAPGTNYLRIKFKALGTANFYASMINDVTIYNTQNTTLNLQEYNTKIPDRSIYNYINSSGTILNDKIILEDALYLEDSKGNPFVVPKISSSFKVTSTITQSTASLSLKWKVLNFGEVVLSTLQLTPNEATYNINLELARYKIAKVDAKIVQMNANGYTVPTTTATSIQNARDKLNLALATYGNNPVATATYADQCMEIIVPASEDLIVGYSDYLIDIRDANSGFTDFKFGCVIYGFDYGNSFKNKFAEIFNFATLPVFWQDDANPPQQENNVNTWINWCNSNNIATKGHALVWFNQSTWPSWITMGAFDTVKLQWEQRAKDVVDKYKSTIKFWDSMNEGHGAYDTSKYTKDQLVEMTRIACAATRSRDAESNIIINNYEPSSETGPTLSYNTKYGSLEYVNKCIQTGTDFNIIGLQHYYCYPYGGVCRDLFEISERLDKWGALGKDVHITEMQVPSSSAPNSNSSMTYDLTKTGIWRGDVLYVGSVVLGLTDRRLGWLGVAVAPGVI